jgi:hypothetical protein
VTPELSPVAQVLEGLREGLTCDKAWRTLHRKRGGMMTLAEWRRVWEIGLAQRAARRG